MLDEKSAIDELDKLFRGPVRPGAKSRSFVVCGGRADARTIAAVSLLAKVTPSGGPRLLWHAWIDPEDWGRADAYWHWNGQDDIWDVAEALKRDLPMIIPKGPLGERLQYLGQAVRLYGSVGELRTAIAEVVAPTDTPARLDSGGPSLYRLGLQVRDQASFLMKMKP